ncbi:MAG: HD domain-containing protein [Myxococcota bacterium]
MAFAADAHRDQTVPGSALPYVVHVANVAMQVMAALSETDGLDGTLAVQCALLHDTLEDTSVTYEQLCSKFGAAVADGVLALTKRKAAGDKEAQMADSLRRIAAQPAEIAIVKLADRITNLQRPPGHWGPDKKRKYQREAQAILQRLGDRNAYLAARLTRRIAEYTRYVEKAGAVAKPTRP